MSATLPILPTRDAGSRPARGISRLIILLSVLTVVVGGVLHAIAIARRQARELADLRRVLPASEQRLAAAALARQSTAKMLAQARDELGELPAPAAPGSPAALRNGEIERWLTRVHRLHSLFATHFEAAIPEMVWLTDDDWLRVAKDAALDADSDIRQALAKVRDAAVAHFRLMAIKALARADKANAKLGTAADLARYFDAPVPPAVLDRYELISRDIGLPGSINFGGDSREALRERAPIDEVYDQRHTFTALGTMVQSGGPETWEEGLRAHILAAHIAYSATHPDAVGQPPLRDVLPYAQPPLDAATIARLLEAEKAAPTR